MTLSAPSVGALSAQSLGALRSNHLFEPLLSGPRNEAIHLNWQGLQARTAGPIP